jgi:hypothetical protein
MRRVLPALALLLLDGAPASAAPAARKPELPAAADIAAVKDKLTIYSDGKKHYLALVLTTDSDSPVFWSADGKDFYKMRIFGGGSEGDAANLKRLDRVFWEPRVNAPYQASFEFKVSPSGEAGGAERSATKGNDAARFEIQCSSRKTALTRLGPDEAKAIVDGAKFYEARWNHRAYALARDNQGRYFYVDKQREPEESKSFRLWAGPKGAMKPQKMINVVSDSQGDIFSTRSGELRLILDKQETTWIQHEKKTKLTWVPVEDNHVLIYTDLGVYTGEPLGTPCDDL